MLKKSFGKSYCRNAASQSLNPVTAGIIADDVGCVLQVGSSHIDSDVFRLHFDHEVSNHTRTDNMCCTVL